MLEIIRRPVVTEKAMRLGENGQYVFIVDTKANKIEIKKAIEEMFEVDVTSVRTIKIKGKVKSRFTKTGVIKGKTPNRKKAIVSLKEGQTIDLVSGEATE